MKLSVLNQIGLHPTGRCLLWTLIDINVNEWTIISLISYAALQHHFDQWTKVGCVAVLTQYVHFEDILNRLIGPCLFTVSGVHLTKGCTWWTEIRNCISAVWRNWHRYDEWKCHEYQVSSLPDCIEDLINDYVEVESVLADYFHYSDEYLACFRGDK